MSQSFSLAPREYSRLGNLQKIEISFFPSLRLGSLEVESLCLVRAGALPERRASGTIPAMLSCDDCIHPLMGTEPS